jgi:hypothetical protein
MNQNPRKAMACVDRRVRRMFYRDTVENVAARVAGTPVRVLNPEALA